MMPVSYASEKFLVLFCKCSYDIRTLHVYFPLDSLFSLFPPHMCLRFSGTSERIFLSIEVGFKLNLSRESPVISSEVEAYCGFDTS